MQRGSSCFVLWQWNGFIQCLTSSGEYSPWEETKLLVPPGGMFWGVMSEINPGSS